MRKTEEANKEYHDQVWWLIPKIRFLLGGVHGNLGWIACQKNSVGDWYGVSFVLGSRSGHLSYVELDTKSPDELALIGAEEILGFPVGSEQDKERKRNYYKELIQSIDQSIEELQDKKVDFEFMLDSI